jgi:arylsulfatase A-like enzyme/predicted negative regulator of RcsB-dependent stress response
MTHSRARPGFIALSFLIAACSRTAAPQRSTSGAGRGYNLLLVTIDTLRADRLDSYGSSLGLTPTLDSLAREGVRFAVARAHVPLTLPSHATIFTGRYPPGTRVHDNGAAPLNVSIPTLATVLKSSGYQTAAFVGAFVLDARFGLNRGFDVYDDRMMGNSATLEVVQRTAEQVLAPAADWILRAPSTQAPGTQAPGTSARAPGTAPGTPAPAPSTQHPAPGTQLRATSPWFAWIHLYDPHEPYAAPEPYRSRYAADAYAGEVAYADAALGSFLTTLRARGALDRTIIVATSDHGEALGDHGEQTHGLFAYESTLRVPLIVRGGPFKPSVVNVPTRLVDVMPSLLDLLGAAAPSDMDGRTFLPAIDGRASNPEQSSYFEALNANLTRNWAPLKGVTVNNLKLIDLPLPELYDLAVDPGENRNLYAAQRDRARPLEALLDAAGTKAPPLAGSAPLDADAEARLRSLGYVVGGTARPGKRYTAEDDPKRLIHLHVALDRAVAEWSAGRAAEAVETLRSVIRQRPDLTVAYDRLAFILKASGQLSEAIALVDEAARKGYADAALLRTLASMHRDVGNLARSAAILEPLVEKNADSSVDPQTLDALAQTYALMGRGADAEALFRRVLNASPSAASTWTNLGALYLTQKRDAEAIDALSRAVAINPTLAGAHNALGVAYIRRGDRQRAVAEWQEALRIRPDYEDARANLERVERRAR